MLFRRSQRVVQYQSAADPEDKAGTNDPEAAAKDANGQPISNGARDIWVTETALTTALNVSHMAEMLAYFSIVVGVAVLHWRSSRSRWRRTVQARCDDAPGTIRTCDLCLRRAALYPLSYGRLRCSPASGSTAGGQCSWVATDRPTSSSASAGTSRRT